MTKQMTIVVIGSLRARYSYYLELWLLCVHIHVYIYIGNMIQVIRKWLLFHMINLHINVILLGPSLLPVVLLSLDQTTGCTGWFRPLFLPYAKRTFLACLDEVQEELLFLMKLLICSSAVTSKNVLYPVCIPHMRCRATSPFAATAQL